MTSNQTKLDRNRDICLSATHDSCFVTFVIYLQWVEQSRIRKKVYFSWVLFFVVFFQHSSFVKRFSTINCQILCVMLDKNGLGSPPLTCLLTHCPIVATQKIFQIYEILKLPTLQFYQDFILGSRLGNMPTSTHYYWRCLFAQEMMIFSSLHVFIFFLSGYPTGVCGCI